jgi:hypothetical protein
VANPLRFSSAPSGITGTVTAARMWWGQATDLVHEDPALVRALLPASGLVLAIVLVLAGQVGWFTQALVFVSASGLLAGLVTWSGTRPAEPPAAPSAERTAVSLPRSSRPRIARRTRL